MKDKVVRHMLVSCFMISNPKAQQKLARKIKKMVQNCTKMDFLTPKCVKEPLKPPAPKSSSSMPVACEIGLSKGQN